MPNEVHALVERRLARFSRAIGWAVAAAGLSVLAGWAFDIPTLKSILPHLATMKANTAVAFVLSGASLWSAHPRAAKSKWTAWVSPVLAALVAVLGLLTLGEYAFGWHLGIDEWLFRDTGSPRALAPGRMAPMTALNFTALALALGLMNVETRRGKRPSHWLALFITANSFLAILGYIYGVDALYRFAALSSVALSTALLFLLVCLGLVCARPGTHFVRQIVADTAAGLINRRLLPAAILIPPFLGWLRWEGEKAGYYDTAFGLALYATSNVAVFTGLVWLSARSAQHLYEQKLALSRVSDWQQAILNSADFTMISTDTQGIIRTINLGATNMLGYSSSELEGATPEVLHDPGEVAARAEALSRELGHEVEPGFEAFVAKARQAGRDEHDWTYIRKDGSRFPVRLSVTWVTGADGESTGFLGIGKDISAQKTAEEALRDSEQRMRLIADNIPALVAYVDREGRYRFANLAFAQVFGVDTTTMIGRTLREVHGERGYAGIADQVERALLGEPVRFEGKGAGRDRGYYYSATYVPDRGPDGSVRGFYALTFDVTSLKTAAMRLAAGEARLRLITDNVPALISYIDRERRFRFNNGTYAQWLGRPLEEITGRRLDEVYDPAMYALLLPQVEEAFQGASSAFEFASPTDGRFIRGTYIPDVDPDGEVIGIYALIHDITAEKETEARLRQLAQFDSLTGLANRNRFNDKLGEAIARSERSGQAMALVFLDLDHFKSINDTLGHQGGDVVLQEFARRLSLGVRETDTVARLGGDEFVLILEALRHPTDVMRVATTIIAAMKAPIEVLDVQRVVSTSVGIAVRRAGETDAEVLLGRADTALYEAKASGRGCFLIQE